MIELNQLFNLTNLFVLPFWTMMVFLPNWQWTQKIMKSYVIFLPLIFVYIYLFITGLNSESIEILSNPKLTDLAQVFSNPNITFAGWVHFLVLDLFLGRYIYWQGQTEKNLDDSLPNSLFIRWSYWVFIPHNYPFYSIKSHPKKQKQKRSN